MTTVEITSKRGAKLAWHVMEFIEQNPEHHDQDSWYVPKRLPGGFRDPLGAQQILEDCGATACFASWTVLLTGHRVVNAWWTEAKHSSIPGKAANLLGLSPQNAAFLFHAARNLEEVRIELERIYGPRPSVKPA